MALKHPHTAVSNEIIQSAFWNAEHTGEITDANHGVRTTANAHSHAHLSGVTADQHHAQSHTLASHSTKAHAELTNVTSDQHHAQSHNMASHTDDYSEGEGIDISVGNVISGEDATTVNKGIASFNTAHFVVNLGATSLNNTVVNAINANSAHRAGDGSDHSLLANKTSYWSYPGSGFTSFTPSTDDNVIDLDNGAATPNSGTLWYGCPVTLPHGAVITAAIVYAQGTNVVWRLYRDTHARSGAPNLMASANTNTQDVTITNPTINNSTHSYWFLVGSLTNFTIIDSVRITYTTNYD